MDLIIIRGGGDIATGIGHRLYKSGFNILISEIEKPTAIRREVSFCEAIYRDEIEVEGVKAVLCKTDEEIQEALGKRQVPVVIDPNCDLAYTLKPIALVDSILAKKNLGTKMDMAPITIGLGPGFTAKEDVHLVVETNRGHYLGTIIEDGKAAEDTGIPGNIAGYTDQRIIRALDEGIMKNYREIGDLVQVGDLLCTNGETEVRANLAGVIRGLLKEGLYVKKGMKIGDIDPRGVVDYAYTISDKARAVGGGVLEAIMRMRRDI